MVVGSSLESAKTALGRRRSLTLAVDHLRLALLQENDLFRDLSKAEVDRIARRLPMVMRHRGDIVHRPELEVEALYIVKAGTVAIYRLAHDGRKVVVALVGPGGVFGEMPLIGLRMGATFAEAAEDAALCVISRTNLEDLLMEYPQVSIGLLRALSRRLLAMEERIEELAVLSVPARVARLLLRPADPSGVIVGFSREELAALLGAARETVSRAIADFRNRGIIESQRRYLRVVDRARLRELCEQDSSGVPSR